MFVLVSAAQSYYMWRVGDSAPAPGVIQGLVRHDGDWDVFRLDLAAIDLQLYGQADTSLRTFASVRGRLAREHVRWAVMTNGGMFHAGEHPVGLHIENGRQFASLDLGTGTGNFYLAPNGVFYLDARGAHVVESHAYAPEGAVELATQSGPLLVSGNALHPIFTASSHSFAKRSGIGVLDPKHVFIAVSRQRVTFHATATLFRDVLHCADALYLDGAISDFDTPQRSGANSQAFGSVLAAVARRPRWIENLQSWGHASRN